MSLSPRFFFAKISFQKESDSVGNILKKLKYLSPLERGDHQQINKGGRDWENMYRDRWSFDKCVRSTHGVNCTGSCSWNIYVKNGLVAWEIKCTIIRRLRQKCQTSSLAAVLAGQVFHGIFTARIEFVIRICAGNFQNFGGRRGKIFQRLMRRGNQ